MCSSRSSGGRGPDGGCPPRPGAPEAARAAKQAVERGFGGTLDGQPEHRCAEALRRVVPDPPTYVPIVPTREAFVAALWENVDF
ncbi:MAG TPA: hypothetical protein VFS43_03945 [Polyangiaceae bacterium]|nr:hypothetical protein [Polyangiaceae bacterium]